MSYKLKIAHISDPHFGQITLSLSQFFSKRWIGNFNQIFNRQKNFDTKRLCELPSLLEKEKIEAVLHTGDFTTTALDEEFDEAFFFAKSFHCQTHSIPGNHDAYTKKVAKDRTFYNYFKDNDLRNERVSLKQLNEKWWTLLLDCAVASPPFTSYGVFFPEMKEKIEKALASLSKDAYVIVCNHFPLFSHGRPLHDLKRSTLLQDILKQYPQVKLYLHGHDHKSYIEVKTFNPLVFNAGSVSRKNVGGFNIYELDQNGFIYHRYKYDKSWECQKKTSFTYI